MFCPTDANDPIASLCGQHSVGQRFADDRSEQLSSRPNHPRIVDASAGAIKPDFVARQRQSDRSSHGRTMRA
jgi:hypothetical protein